MATIGVGQSSLDPARSPAEGNYYQILLGDGVTLKNPTPCTRSDTTLRPAPQATPAVI
jgi:hypothetical protein